MHESVKEEFTKLKRHFGDDFNPGQELRDPDDYYNENYLNEHREVLEILNRLLDEGLIIKTDI